MWIFLVIVTGAAGALAGFYAWTVFQKLLENQIGHPRVKELSNIIHGGAMAFLKKEYTWLAPFVAVVAILLVACLGIGAAFAFILGALHFSRCSFFNLFCNIIAFLHSRFINRFQKAFCFSGGLLNHKYSFYQPRGAALS